MAVAHKTGTQNRTLVSGNMDQNLRNPSCLILSHTHMGVVLYSFARDWALGPRLRGTCAYLRARSGAETRFRRPRFAKFSCGLRASFSKQCVCRSHSNPQRLCPLRSLPAIQCQQHTLDPTERTAGSATQLGHSLKERKCMLRVPIHCLNRAAKDIRDSMARCLAGASRACAQLARGLRAACADFVLSIADC